jgi:beta-1,2-mannobiose phosphorylase / 1,2-beta-oligomannan phosphorylase
MMLIRHAENPLIRPADVKPSRPDFEIIGTFNAGVTQYQGETLLLVRVAERPRQIADSPILCPHLSDDGQLIITAIDRNDPLYDTSDPRKVEHIKTKELLLTSISHLRLARSRDGVHFSVDEQPWLASQPPYETFGVEDARITKIGDRYYVNYTAVSRYGIATALVSTPDFVEIERHPLMFVPSNRDVALFPERINGLYRCYHRPMPGFFGGLNIWSAASPDLIHWGQAKLVLEAGTAGWEAGRVGGGAPPLKTEHGWLSIYHAADSRDRYCLGAFLTPLDDPDHVIARSLQPILVPEADYETNGFFGQVVFTCGALLNGETVSIYYGAADETIALVEMPLADILDHLTPQG